MILQLSLNRFTDRMFEQVDASSLVFFRIGLGGIMLVECWRYYDHGWIERYYMDPDFFFTYYGFGWVTPLPGDQMFWVFGVLAVLSLCVTVGLFYRVTIVLLWLVFTYIFLLDQARYLNHFYFTSLLMFLLALTPAHRAVSIDAWLGPGLRRRHGALVVNMDSARANGDHADFCGPGQSQP